MQRELLAQVVQQLAGPSYYGRGSAYFEQGRVLWLDEGEDGIIARVRGTHDYTVRLWEEEGEILYECECPVGQDDEFCKHCVATALAWLGEAGIKPEPSGASSPRRNQFDDIRTYLASLAPKALIDLVVNACQRDDRLRENLLLAARGRGNVHAAVKAWKAALRRVTASRGFVDYGEMPAFVEGIWDVVTALNGWIADGRAAQVIELAEYAAQRVAEFMNECDDSEGRLGSLLCRIGELHLTACRAAPPDPEELAERLFDYELSDDWETFSSVATRYAEVLGERGLARYRQLAEAEWAKVPALGPGGDKNQTWKGNRYRITEIMEALARRADDVEALVAVKARDLSSAWRFLQIAETYRNAGQPDQALAWAERGLAVFPQRTDNRLREFVIEDYLRRGRGEEAMALAWTQFAEGPELGNYSKLTVAVQRAGGDWPAWRDRALAHLRQQMAREFAERSKLGYGRRIIAADHSRLVEILLSEQEVEAAWREAGAGACREELRLRLADLRAREHPEDSLAVYQPQVTRLAEQTNNAAYAQAMNVVNKIRPLLLANGGEPRWSAYRAELRAKFKAKRNFMKLLDELK
jgi:hypothetical protein